MQRAGRDGTDRAGVGAAVSGPGALTKEELEEQVASLHWYHSIDLGDGVVTPGDGAPNQEAVSRAMPDLSGRSVLDIGAWDGLYSFLAERRGASRVVAMDHYAWGVDFAARNAYWKECEELGVLPDTGRDTTEFYRPQELPGRKGFELAHRALGSRVEPVVADFMEVDPGQLGQFDVVLFLGVLYHIREPLRALDKVRSLTRGVAVIESEAVRVCGSEEASLLEFYAGDEWMGDHTNWFAPTEQALSGMCRAAGFRRVETKIGPPPAKSEPSRVARALRRRFDVERRRRAVRGSESPPEPRSELSQIVRATLDDVGSARRPPPEHYRILVHAFA